RLFFLLLHRLPFEMGHGCLVCMNHPVIKGMFTRLFEYRQSVIAVQPRCSDDGFKPDATMFVCGGLLQQINLCLELMSCVSNNTDTRSSRPEVTRLEYLMKYVFVYPVQPPGDPQGLNKVVIVIVIFEIQISDPFADSSKNLLRIAP